MKKLLSYYSILFALLGVAAFICAPHSCDWGNGAYFFTGILCMVISVLLPLLQKNWNAGKRIGYAFLFFIVSIFLWCLFFALFDFKIMCRLF